MTGWAAEHDFRVPDRARAESLVDDLVDHGFPLVTARPYKDHWLVTVRDGPYRTPSIRTASSTRLAALRP